MTLATLSKPKEKILSFIDHFVTAHGHSPTIREICEGTGYRSTSTVHTHVHNLAKFGYLTLEENKPRTIVDSSLSPDREVFVTVSKRRLEALERTKDAAMQVYLNSHMLADNDREEYVPAELIEELHLALIQLKEAVSDG